MAIGARLSRKASPELIKCGNPKCDYLFWRLGNQKYCSKKCYKEIERPRIVERTRKCRKNKKVEKETTK